MLQTILTALALSLSTPPGTQVVTLPEPTPAYVNSTPSPTRIPLVYSAQKRSARDLAALTR